VVFRALVAFVVTAALVVGCTHTPPAPSPTPPAPASAPAPGAGSTSTPPTANRHFWTFWRRPSPAPQPVEELVVAPAPGTSADFQQFWERNTLVIDMRSASGRGSATFRPREHTLWPVRLAFRVVPGSIGELEVRGAERTVFAVAASGTAPVDLRLGASAYTGRTPAITVVWGPAAALPEP
jgi:hypothetical protein